MSFLESGLDAVTHSQMSGSLTDSVSGALLSCPGFDGIGSYTQSNSTGQNTHLSLMEVKLEGSAWGEKRAVLLRESQG